MSRGFSPIAFARLSSRFIFTSLPPQMAWLRLLRFTPAAALPLRVERLRELPHETAGVSEHACDALPQHLGGGLRGLSDCLQQPRRRPAKRPGVWRLGRLAGLLLVGHRYSFHSVPIRIHRRRRPLIPRARACRSPRRTPRRRTCPARPSCACRTGRRGRSRASRRRPRTLARP